MPVLTLRSTHTSQTSRAAARWNPRASASLSPPFHANLILGLRFLQVEHARANLRRGFTILDADDTPAETEADEPAPVEPDAAEPEPEIEDDEAKPEEPPAKPAPTVSGEAHQPRTDADITGASSLFDL